MYIPKEYNIRAMKRTTFAALSLGIFLTANSLSAQPKDIGKGLVIGKDSNYYHKLFKGNCYRVTRDVGQGGTVEELYYGALFYNKLSLVDITYTNGKATQIYTIAEGLGATVGLGEYRRSDLDNLVAAMNPKVEVPFQAGEDSQVVGRYVWIDKDEKVQASLTNKGSILTIRVPNNKGE